MTAIAHSSDIQKMESVETVVTAKAVAEQISELEADHGRVRELLRPAANTIDVTASVMAAADRMWLSGADCLMVMEGDRCVGMITDRDLIVGCVSRQRRPTRTSVRDIMSAVSPGGGVHLATTSRRFAASDEGRK